MTKQSMEASEPYFVHIGYTYANELRKYKRRDGKLSRQGKLKMRVCVKKKLDKLNTYWGESLK